MSVPTGPMPLVAPWVDTARPWLNDLRTDINELRTDVDNLIAAGFHVLDPLDPTPSPGSLPNGTLIVRLRPSED